MVAGPQRRATIFCSAVVGKRTRVVMFMARHRDGRW
jgi:hypothetical protein